MKKIKVTVTKEDIKNGVKCEGHSCPIALATSRLFGDRFQSNHVDCNQARITLRSKDLPLKFTVKYYNLSRAAKRFIAKFDKPYGRKSVKPISFIMMDVTEK